jgi:hypothetical protein
LCKKCPRYEHPTSYHYLIFPTRIFYGTVFNICIVLGRSYLGYFCFPQTYFTFHGWILLLDFRLYVGLAEEIFFFLFESMELLLLFWSIINFTIFSNCSLNLSDGTNVSVKLTFKWNLPMYREATGFADSEMSFCWAKLIHRMHLSTSPPNLETCLHSQNMQVKKCRHPHVALCMLCVFTCICICNNW